MSDLTARADLLAQIESQRHAKAILYATGDRDGLETRIGQDVIDLFVDHLDDIGPVERIALLLYTSGGNTSAAWNIVNLVRMFCDDFEVIAPGKCMSAGTLISLGADRIVMTKQATLGPIDPTIQHPLGPSIPGASPDARAGVSVEAVNGYLDEMKKGGLEGTALLDLAKQVHPLVLGQIFRSRQQIRDLAHRLLKPQDIKSLSNEMELRIPFQMNTYAARTGAVDYSFTRAVIESTVHGAHHFVSEGRVETTELTTVDGPALKQTAVQDQRTFDGWRKVHVP